MLIEGGVRPGSGIRDPGSGVRGSGFVESRATEQSAAGSAIADTESVAGEGVAALFGSRIPDPGSRPVLTTEIIRDLATFHALEAEWNDAVGDRRSSAA